MQYEILYLIGDSNASNLDRIKNEVKQIIITEGGLFVEPELTKKRKMSYQIKNDIRGTYITQRFNLTDKDAENYNPSAIANCNKKLTLYPDLLRFILVNAEELPELKEKDESAKKTVKTESTTSFKKRNQEEIKKEPSRFIARKEIPAQKPIQNPQTDNRTKKEEELPSDIDKKLEEILKI